MNTNNNEEFSAPGWDAIVRECERVYPGQENPIHFMALIKWQLGGKDPLDGISVYDGGDYWHFVTFGLSELYEKKAEDKKISGYGMEFTFKLRKSSLQDEAAELNCVCGILQTLARLTFTQGEIFSAYEYIYTGQTTGFDANAKSSLTGFITIPDKELQTIETPNGTVRFIELIGVTNNELLAVHNHKISVRELYQRLGSDVTDYSRGSIK